MPTINIVNKRPFSILFLVPRYPHGFIIGRALVLINLTFLAIGHLTQPCVWHNRIQRVFRFLVWKLLEMASETRDTDMKRQIQAAWVVLPSLTMQITCYNISRDVNASRFAPAELAFGQAVLASNKPSYSAA